VAGWRIGSCRSAEALYSKALEKNRAVKKVRSSTRVVPLMITNRIALPPISGPKPAPDHSEIVPMNATAPSRKRAVPNANPRSSGIPRRGR
jgi:hypothetical protein